MHTFSTHQEELEYLKQLGFAVNPYNCRAQDLKQVWQVAQEIDLKKQNLPYQIDGVVVKLNDNHLAEKLGTVGKTPRGHCAIKFTAEETTTKLLDITWQVGRTGKLTPVAELEPTNLQGTVVRRATLHNYQQVVEMQLKEQDLLIIRKAGEIIPEVVKVVATLAENDSQILPTPHTCPVCTTELRLNETKIDLFCPNTQNCPAQVLGRLSYFCQRSVGNISGLSAKNLQKFYLQFGVRDIPDLFDLPYQEIAQLEGFGSKSAANIQESVDKARQINDFKFLAGLGIEGIGSETAKLICRIISD